MWSLFEKLGCPSRKKVETIKDETKIIDEPKEVSEPVANIHAEPSEYLSLNNEIVNDEVIRVKYGENKEYDEAYFKEMENMLIPYLKNNTLRAIKLFDLKGIVINFKEIDIMIEINDFKELINMFSIIIKKNSALKYKTYLGGSVFIFKKKTKMFGNKKESLVQNQYNLNVKVNLENKQEVIMKIECDA